MRILWVGEETTNLRSGNEVFDQKTIDALRAQGHTIVTFYPKRTGRLRRLLSFLTGTAHYRSWFDSPENRLLCQQAGTDCDVTICSWEPLDILVPHLQRPVIIILHNITSLALVALFPSSWLASLASRQAASWERHLYQRNNVAAVAVLSRRDQDYLINIPDAPKTILTVPGMPPVVKLAPDAQLREELVLLGTYDWFPKRRDVVRFLQEYAALPSQFPLFASALPPAANAAGVAIAGSVEDLDHGAAIRFGLISDRFQAGHKLKTLAYIAQNQIVLSFTDVKLEFADIPDHALFLRTLASAEDIGKHMAEIFELGPEIVRARFVEFQQRCAEHFTWNVVAERLAGVAESIRDGQAPPEV